MNAAALTPSSANPGTIGRWARVTEAVRTIGRATESERIRSLLRSAPGPRLLDVGGRTGAFTSRFVQPDDPVVVLEPDHDAARVGERRHPRYRFVSGRGEDIPFPPATFDRVTAIRSTHHMAAPEQFFSEAHRVLSPGGRIVIEEIAHRSGLARIFSAIGRHHRHPPMDFRDRGDWAERLTEAGFEDVCATAAGRWYIVTGRKRPGSDASPPDSTGAPLGPAEPP